MSNSLLLKYAFAKTIVIDEGFQNEIFWQSNLNFDNINETSFLREIAWVILTCGMKEAIVRDKFEEISNCFFKWESVKKILLNRDYCLSSALKIFNNKKKMLAIFNAVEQLNKIGFMELKERVRTDPINTLLSFDYIGPITVYHLAKNIGLPVAKPDRHLVRIAEMENYSNVQTFCRDVSNLSGDSIPVVDIVFWRFATIDKDYLKVLSSLNDGEKIYYNDHNINQYHSSTTEFPMFQ